MVGFRTKNSEYHVDEEHKTITGGMFKEKLMPYKEVVAIPGFKAQITLSDGSYYETSQVVSHL